MLHFLPYIQVFNLYRGVVGGVLCVQSLLGFQAGNADFSPFWKFDAVDRPALSQKCQ